MIERDDAGEQRAGHDQADAGHVEELVDEELGRLLALRRPRAARGHQVEELAQQGDVCAYSFGQGA